VAIIETSNINKAAFYTAHGAKLISVKGRPPESVFKVDAPEWLIGFEKNIGIVPYRKYVNQRTRLKTHARKAAGLPARYMSKKNQKVTLNDILGFNLKEAYKENK